ncbi:MAG: FAD-dependent oxidoreductase [Oleiphilus sp.]|nr:MAG: FAD-dependent oxidoreductase [Oleiphilus sp.]
MEHYDLDCVVVGAGVIGLAVARAMALACEGSGRQVWLLERNAAIGMETSSRNSEVIHAGIYYPQGSLKAELCVRGKALLYEYCERHKVPYARCGKLIVASNPGQQETLESIAKRAENNGVADLRFLDARGVRALEPALSATGALISPSTGIIDSHAYMTQVLTDFEAAGGQLVTNTSVKMVDASDHAIALELPEQNASIRAQLCVNACGLNAITFSQAAGIKTGQFGKIRFAKGDYFAYSGQVPFSHLVYPVPEPGGLGIHLTLDMQGYAKFGPDVDWLGEWTQADEIDYQVDPLKRDKFAASVRQYWPGLEEERLQADYSGVRPKLSGPNDSPADFVIQDRSSHGVDGLINLLGFESPGLTASLAIAEEVKRRLLLERS